MVPSKRNHKLPSLLHHPRRLSPEAHHSLLFQLLKPHTQHEGLPPPVHQATHPGPLKDTQDTSKDRLHLRRTRRMVHLDTPVPPLHLPLRPLYLMRWLGFLRNKRL